MLPFTPSSNAFHAIDRFYHAWQGRLSGGLSPSSLSQAYQDWWSQLANSPGKQAELMLKAARKWERFGAYALARLQGADAPPAIEPLPQDRRWRDPAWQSLPFALYQQGFLLTQQWWHNASTEVHGRPPPPGRGGL